MPSKYTCNVQCSLDFSFAFCKALSSADSMLPGVGPPSPPAPWAASSCAALVARAAALSKALDTASDFGSPCFLPMVVVEGSQPAQLTFEPQCPPNLVSVLPKPSPMRRVQSCPTLMQNNEVHTKNMKKYEFEVVFGVLRFTLRNVGSR